MLRATVQGVSIRNTLVILPLLICLCGVRKGNANPQPLPFAVIRALATDEASYCDQFQGNFRRGCHQTFRKNLLWRQLVVTPSGETAILVENMNMGFCGSAGCSLYLFVRQSDKRLVQVLGAQGDVGNLEEIKVLTVVTNGHFDVLKTWADGKTGTTYRWDGMRYSAG